MYGSIDDGRKMSMKNIFTKISKFETLGPMHQNFATQLSTSYGTWRKILEKINAFFWGGVLTVAGQFSVRIIIFDRRVFKRLATALLR